MFLEPLFPMMLTECQYALEIKYVFILIIIYVGVDTFKVLMSFSLYNQYISSAP